MVFKIVPNRALIGNIPVTRVLMIYFPFDQTGLFGIHRHLAHSLTMASGSGAGSSKRKKSEEFFSEHNEDKFQKNDDIVKFQETLEQMQKEKLAKWSVTKACWLYYVETRPGLVKWITACELRELLSKNEPED